MLGVTHLKTTPYHPQANGIIERWQRTFKAAIKCHNTNDWSEILPLILLGMRTTFKADISATPAEMLYGSTLRIPGEFLNNKLTTDFSSEIEFLKELRRKIDKVKPTKASNHHTSEKFFVQKELGKCTHVFVRNDTVRKPLQPPYDGPYEVLERNEKYFKIKINNRTTKISIDRLKAAFITVEENLNDPQTQAQPQPQLTPLLKTRSGRQVKIPYRYH